MFGASSCQIPLH